MTKKKKLGRPKGSKKTVFFDMATPLKAWAARYKINGPAAAEALGVTRMSWSLWQRGKHQPNMDALIRGDARFPGLLRAVFKAARRDADARCEAQKIADNLDPPAGVKDDK